MANAWHYAYTDFGEGQGRSPQPVLRAVVAVATPGLSTRFAAPVQWRGIVAVLDPWPHQGTAVILGQSGFLDAFTVTFGPDGFVLEPATAFRRRFPPTSY